MIGALFTQYITLQGSLPNPVQWNVSGRPSWLQQNQLSPTSLELTGTPTTDGQFNLSIEVSAGRCKYNTTNSFRIWPRLQSLANPYLQASFVTKLAEVFKTITGGKPPYRCQQYYGPGQGTVPSGIQQDPNDSTGCTLLGQPDTSNLPGTYGFIMMVRDSLGQLVEIPVSYTHGSCNNPFFQLTPSVDALPVKPIASTYEWRVDIKNIDYYNSFNVCRYELYLMLTHAALSAGPNLSCFSPDPICVSCNATEQSCVNTPSTCPAVISMYHFVRIRQHTAIRPNNAPAFLSLQLRYTYSINKSQSCHWDTLETQ
jgi:hypothetical protein